MKWAGILDSLLSRSLFSIWNTYWFGATAPYSTAVVRIAVVASLLINPPYLSDYHTFLSIHAGATYYPKGLLILLGSTPPSAAVCESIKVLATISSWLALLGLATRLSLAVSFICHAILTAVMFAFMPTWSHGHNVILMALAPLPFTASNRVFALDAVVRSLAWPKVLNQSATATPTRWAVLLSQYAVAFMFADAAFHKLAVPNFGLDWALSDSLRHWLVVQYAVLVESPPPLVQWIMAHEIGYKGAALGNLIAQCAPLLACVVPGYPWLRAALGLPFVLEVIGLGVVMRLWNPQWLLLYATFVDWDRLMATPTRRHVAGLAILGAVWGAVMLRGVWSPVWLLPAVVLVDWAALLALLRPGWVACSAVGPAQTAVLPRRPVVPSVVIVVFLGLTAAVAKDTNLTHRALFPFTAFPMYYMIAAKSPVSTHQSFEFIASSYEARAPAPLPQDLERWISRNYFYAAFSDDLSEVQATLQRIKASIASIGNTQPWAQVEEITMRRVIFQVPPYPAAPRAEPFLAGLRGKITRDNHFIGVSATVNWDQQRRQEYVTMDIRGMPPPLAIRVSHLPITWARNVIPGVQPPHVVDGEWIDNRFYYPLPKEASYMVLIHLRPSGSDEPESVWAGPIVYH
jgi:hypothetical protein